MKKTLITATSFILFFSGCASSNQMTENSDIEVVRAGFKHWSEAPLVGSDVRERGTDLELIVANWPETADPQYIVFRGKKSFPAEVADTTESEVEIVARIIMRSAVFAEASESVELSDRLVFTGPGGKTGYVEIEEWSHIED